MDKTNISVTMPVTEYERLVDIEKSFNEHIRMFANANKDGVAVMTEKLKMTIEEIYL